MASVLDDLFTTPRPRGSKRTQRGYLSINAKIHPIFDGLNPIGRNLSATVNIKNINISHTHAIITVVDKSRFFMSDFKSSNKTILNGEELEPFVLYPLNDQDNIIFAETVTVFHLAANENGDCNNDEATQDVTQSFYGAHTQIVDNTWDNREDNSKIIDIHEMATQVELPRRFDINEMPTQFFPLDASHNMSTKDGDETDDSTNKEDTKLEPPPRVPEKMPAVEIDKSGYESDDSFDIVTMQKASETQQAGPSHSENQDDISTQASDLPNFRRSTKINVMEDSDVETDVEDGIIQPRRLTISKPNPLNSDTDDIDDTSSSKSTDNTSVNKEEQQYAKDSEKSDDIKIFKSDDDETDNEKDLAKLDDTDIIPCTQAAPTQPKSNNLVVEVPVEENANEVNKTTIDDSLQMPVEENPSEVDQTTIDDSLQMELDDSARPDSEGENRDLRNSDSEPNSRSHSLDHSYAITPQALKTKEQSLIDWITEPLKAPTDHDDKILKKSPEKNEDNGEAPLNQIDSSEINGKSSEENDESSSIVKQAEVREVNEESPPNLLQPSENNEENEGDDLYLHPTQPLRLEDKRKEPEIVDNFFMQATQSLERLEKDEKSVQDEREEETAVEDDIPMQPTPLLHLQEDQNDEEIKEKNVEEVIKENEKSQPDKTDSYVSPESVFLHPDSPHRKIETPRNISKSSDVIEATPKVRNVSSSLEDELELMFASQSVMFPATQQLVDILEDDSDDKKATTTDEETTKKGRKPATKAASQNEKEDADIHEPSTSSEVPPRKSGRKRIQKNLEIQVEVKVAKKNSNSLEKTSADESNLTETRKRGKPAVKSPTKISFSDEEDDDFCSPRTSSSQGSVKKSNLKRELKHTELEPKVKVAKKSKTSASVTEIQKVREPAEKPSTRSIESLEDGDEVDDFCAPSTSNQESQRTSGRKRLQKNLEESAVKAAKTSLEKTLADESNVTEKRRKSQTKISFSDEEDDDFCSPSTSSSYGSVRKSGRKRELKKGIQPEPQVKVAKKSTVHEATEKEEKSSSKSVESLRDEDDDDKVSSPKTSTQESQRKNGRKRKNIEITEVPGNSLEIDKEKVDKKGKKIPPKKSKNNPIEARAKKTVDDDTSSVSSVDLPSTSSESGRSRRLSAHSRSVKAQAEIKKTSTPTRGRKKLAVSPPPEEPTTSRSRRTTSGSETSLISQERNKRKIKPKVVFTMMDNPKLESLIRHLGGSVVDAVDSCTVLVTEHVKRTSKLLAAVGQGKPICSPEWLEECKKVSTFLDPWDFVMEDREAEEKWDFSLRESLERAQNSKLFENYTFMILVSAASAVEVLKGAILSSGGKCISRGAPKNGDKFVIVATPEHKVKFTKIVKTHPGAIVVEPEAVFDGTLRQEIRFEDHIINK